MSTTGPGSSPKSVGKSNTLRKGILNPKDEKGWVKCMIYLSKFKKNSTAFQYKSDVFQNSKNSTNSLQATTHSQII